MKIISALKQQTREIVNSITDPGVGFNLGTTPISWAQHWLLGLANLGVAGFCFCVRLASELKKSGHNLNFLGSAINKLLINKGAAFAIDGFAGIAIALAALFTIEPDIAKDPKKAAAVIGGFGIGKIFRALAVGMKPESRGQALTNSFGVVCTAIALNEAIPNAPIALKMAFGGAAISGVYLAFKDRQAYGIAQPEIIFAGSALAASKLSPEFAYVAANFIWSLSCLSVDALKKNGGVYQAFPRPSRASLPSPK